MALLRKILELLTGKAAVRYVPPAPQGFVPSLPAEDEAAAFTSDDVLGIAFAIRYVDSEGRSSRRRITVREIKSAGGGPIYIGAHCHERNAYRTFRADRVTEMVSLATGEVLPSAEAALRAIVADHITMKAVQECRHELQVLAYVGRVDGHFSEPEQEIAARMVEAQFPRDDIDPRRLRQIVADLFPDDESFRLSLAELSRARSGKRLFLETLRDLIEADGQVHPEEAALLAAVKSGIRRQKD